MPRGKSGPERKKGTSINADAPLNLLSAASVLKFILSFMLYPTSSQSPAQSLTLSPLLERIR